MPKVTLLTSTTRTTKIYKPNQSLTTSPFRPCVGGGVSKTAKDMKAKKIIYTIGAVICSTLAIIFRTVTLPIALTYDALDAMANTSNETADHLLENTKKHE